MNLLPSPNPAIVVLDPRQVQPDYSDSEADTENETESESETHPRLRSLIQRQTGRSLSLTQASPSVSESGSTQTNKSHCHSHSNSQTQSQSQSRGSRRSRSSVSFSASSNRHSFVQTTGTSVLPIPPMPAFAGAFPNLDREADQHRNVAPPGDLFKTEMCRSYEENGWCRYGPKCQFAHGYEELRQPPRHPKYKTEICKTFHSIGTCQYGKRCRFIHNTASGADTERPLTTTTATAPISIPSQGNPTHSKHGPSNTNTNTSTLSTTPDDFFGKSLLPPPTCTGHTSLPLPLPLPQLPYPYTYNHTAATATATATATAPPLHADDSLPTPAHSPFRCDSATWSYASPFLASDTSSLASDLSDNGVRSRSSSTRSRGDSVRRRLHIFEELGNAWDTQPLQTAVKGLVPLDSVPRVLVFDPDVDLALDLDFEISSPTFNASVMASVDAILDDTHE